MKILPSIIASDLTDISSTIQKFGLAECHFDVMDGVFVPEISIGSFVARDLSKKFPYLKLDVHLMVYDTTGQLEHFLGLPNVFRIIFHYESVRHHRRLAESIKNAGKDVGIALNPETSPEALEYLIDVFDCVCVMTVPPGYAGQRFIKACMPKISKIRDARDRLHPECKILIDGGVTKDMMTELTQLGVDEVVMGSAFFG